MRLCYLPGTMDEEGAGDDPEDAEDEEDGGDHHHGDLGRSNVIIGQTTEGLVECRS